VLEQPTLAVFDTIAVEPTRDVLLRGADAISGGVFLFAHHHVPARPATVSGDRAWLAMLALTETIRRGEYRPLKTPDLADLASG
jgi:hypothetical protein